MHLCLPHQRSGPKHNHLSQTPWGLWNLSASLPASSCLQAPYSHLPQGAEIAQNLLLVGMWSLRSRLYFWLVRLPSNMPQLICPLAKLWADLLGASHAFSVLFLPYVTSKTLAQSKCQILGGREVGWVGHNFHYRMQHTQLDTPYKKRHLDSDTSKVVLTKSKRGEFSELEQHCSVRTWYRWQGSERYLAGHC